MSKFRFLTIFSILSAWTPLDTGTLNIFINSWHTFRPWDIDFGGPHQSLLVSSKNRTLFHFVFIWIEANFGLNGFFSQNLRRSNFPDVKFPCSDLQPVKRYSHVVCGPKKSQKGLYWWEPKHAIWEKEATACQHCIVEAWYFVQWWNKYNTWGLFVSHHYLPDDTGAQKWANI